MTTDAPLSGRIAVVTGSGRGIGRAIALELARQGADVVVTARTRAEIVSVAEEIRTMGRKSLAIEADVSVEEDVRRLAERAAADLGPPSVLINNAGIGVFANVVDMETADLQRMWEVNLRGVFLCTRAFVPSMIRRGSGDIVNIASLAGRNAFVGGAGYCATKWALIGFSRCLMLEVRKHNIRVVTICPGSVDTSFGGGDGGAPKSSGEIPAASDIARITVDALLMPRHVMVSEIDVRPTNPKG